MNQDEVKNTEESQESKQEVSTTANVKTDWQEHAREDLQLIPLFGVLGWQVNFNVEDRNAKRTKPETPPEHPVSFKCGNNLIAFNVEKNAWVMSAFINNAAKPVQQAQTLTEIAEHLMGEDE